MDEDVIFFGSGIEFEPNEVDKPNIYNESTQLNGFCVEFELTDEEKIVREDTTIMGFTLELEDFPYYVFTINEKRYPNGTFYTR